MRSRSSITGPLVLIVVGVIFLIHAISPNFRLIDLVSHYWPYGLILWGVIALVEVFIRFRGNGPVPKNGISGGAWALVIFVALLGSSAFEFQRPDNWLRQIGFEGGMEAFGEEHQYPIETAVRNVGPEPHIVIENFRGDAKITGVDGGSVSLSGHKIIRSFDTADADKSNTQTPVEILTQGNVVTIRCHQDGTGRRSLISADLELSVPRGASVEAAASHGSIEVSAISGSLDITGNHSDIKADEIGGNVKLETGGADSVQCTNLKGALDLRGRGSNIEFENISGQVTVAGSFTGTVSLKNLSKNVHLENLRTQLEARQIPGYVRLDRGSFDGKNVIGPVRLSAHSTDITLAGFTEGLDLNLDRGDVELRPEHSAMGRIAVHTKGGNIELAIPSAARFALMANTENGEIENEFGDTLRESSVGRGARLEGSVGSGPDVNLVTQHGSITVRKASGENANVVQSPPPAEGMIPGVSMLAFN